MWQAKIPFASTTEKEQAVDKLALFGHAGIWEKDAELIVYFPSEKAMVDCLHALGSQAALHERVSEKIDWIARWKRFHKPVRIKPFIIVPPFLNKSVPATPPYKKKIIIDPSFAFGTGSHPTTRLCIGYLARVMHKDLSVIDVGTGSGILAICAEKLGARAVRAVDIDETALAEAAKNIRRNRCTRITLSSTLGRPTPHDIGVCNILCDDILGLKDELSCRLRKGALLILSGLLADQKEIIVERFADNFRIQGTKHMRDKNFRWLALLLEKR